MKVLRKTDIANPPSGGSSGKQKQKMEMTS